jgi:hypothetical protein
LYFTRGHLVYWTSQEEEEEFSAIPMGKMTMREWLSSSIGYDLNSLMKRLEKQNPSNRNPRNIQEPSEERTRMDPNSRYPLAFELEDHLKPSGFALARLNTSVQRDATFFLLLGLNGRWSLVLLRMPILKVDELS